MQKVHLLVQINATSCTQMSHQINIGLLTREIPISRLCWREVKSFSRIFLTSDSSRSTERIPPDNESTVVGFSPLHLTINSRTALILTSCPGFTNIIFCNSIRNDRFMHSFFIRAFEVGLFIT